MDIEITNCQNHITIDSASLTLLAQRVLAGEGLSSAIVSIAIVDDAAIHSINQRYLGHDWPTDVITFPLSGASDELLEAELIVSAEMAATTARQAGTDPMAELVLYVIHGLLHLCGFDDKDPESAAAMRARESEVLQREGWVNTFPIIGPPGRRSASCRA